ncbi:MAG: ROK family protein [Candidatus Saccharibacteria bacterium]|nr:ROK family protein [Candidatus Saccharibacteria bacterium]
MYLSVDIGGTKTLIALFSKRGRLMRRRKFKTAQGSRTFLHDLTGHLADFQKYKIRSIVVAVPGVVQKNYSVQFGNRKWGDIDIFTPIKNMFSCPIYFENDANLGALYEAYRLPGKTVFLTFSTGIGGGIVEHNRILPESSKFEPGHKKYRYDGKLKEWEDIASAEAIGNFYHVDTATDLRKKDVMKDIAKRVYLGIPDVVKEYQPDKIVLGGPLGKIFRLYEDFLPKDQGIKYRRPKRPNESVIYGCYLLARQKERK